MTQMGRLAVATFALLLVVTPARAALAAITCPSAASIPSVTSGYAPLAVFFDATATTDSNTTIPFQDLLFSWSFGDVNAGTWNFSGQSKNKAIGGVAAHVFETVGTYTPILSVTNSSGQTCSVTLPTITVTNPAASLTTWCFSTTADFTGCPGGATRVTQSNFNTIMASYVATNRRLLLHAGQTFTATARSATAAGPWMLASFGSGAKPIISTDTSLFDLHSTSEIVLQDLDIRNTVGAAGSGNNFCGTYNLLLRVDAQGFDNNSLCDVNGVPPWPGFHHVTWVDGTWQNFRGYNAFLGGTHFSIMGMDFGLFIGPNTGSGHNLRVQVAQKSVISHNKFEPQNYSGFKSQLKWHSGHFDSRPDAPFYQQASQFSIFSFNTVYGGTNNSCVWPTNFAPANDATDERLHDLVVENNYFTVSAGAYGASVTTNPVRFSVTNSTVRNNIVDAGTTSAATICFSLETNGVEPKSGSSKFYNNTCTYRGSHSGFRAFSVVSTTENSVFRNNLAYITSPSPTMVTAGTADTIDHNVLDVSGSPFATANWAVPTDYQIASPDPAVIGAGTSVPVLTDFGLTLRGRIWDIGAWAWATSSGGLGQPGRPTPVP